MTKYKSKYDKIIEENKKREDEKIRLKEFCQYIINKYGAKGRRTIRFSARMNEIDILLGLKDASKFDDEDKSYLSEEQLKELDKFIKKEKDSKMFGEDYGQTHYRIDKEI